MTRSIKLLTIFTAIIMLSAFTVKDTDLFIGTYGVSDTDPSGIKLTIIADRTYYYQDYSVPTKKINVTGNWTQKGKRVILDDSNSGIKFHNVWTFEENGQIAKSRKGLCFYRLSKIDV